MGTKKDKPSTTPKSPHLDSIGHPACKRRGEASEAEFIARAFSLNLPVAKLWGESGPIDTLVGTGETRQFWRVQIKCACISQHGHFEVRGGGHHLYTEDDIDFLAAHIVTENTWYIIPISAFQGRPNLNLFPNPQRRRSRGRYEKYREAWCLLACEPKARGWKDIPVLCRCRELEVRCAVCPNEQQRV